MRTWAFGMSALVAAALLAAGPADAATINACAKLSNGKLRKLTVGTAPAPSCNVNTEAPVSVGADTSPLIAYARIDMSSVAIDSFGGNGTTGASIIGAATGVVQLQFTGTYAAGLDASKITLLASAQSFNYDVSNARIDFADAGNVYVTIFDWFSNIGAGGENKNVVFMAIIAAP